MFLKEEELQRLIKEEYTKVINEALAPTLRRAIAGVFGDGDPRTARLISGFEENPTILDMPDGELRRFFGQLDVDEADKVADAIISARRGVPTNLDTGELIDVSGEVIGTVQNALVRSSRVNLEPQQTRQMLTIVRNSDNLPAAKVADDLADAIPSFNPKKALAALAAIGVVTAGGKIAWDNFGKGAVAAPGAPSGGGTSTGRPVPQPGGAAPAPLPPTSGGGAMDPAWERYIEVTGSKSWSNPEEARAVYDAWQDYVKAQPVKEQQGQYTSDFESFKTWWQSQNNPQLGPKETIRILKNLTAAPEAPAEPTVDTEPEVVANPEKKPAPTPAPAPAAAKLAADGNPASPLSQKYEENLALLKKAQAEYAADKGERSFIKSVVINKYPALKGSFAVGKGGMDDDVTKTEILRAIRLTMEKEAQQYKRLRDRELRQMQRKTKRISESVINESVYNRWQTLIKN